MSIVDEAAGPQQEPIFSAVRCGEARQDVRGGRREQGKASYLEGERNRGEGGQRAGRKGPWPCLGKDSAEVG